MYLFCICHMLETTHRSANSNIHVHGHKPCMSFNVSTRLSNQARIHYAVLAVKFHCLPRASSRSGGGNTSSTVQNPFKAVTSTSQGSLLKSVSGTSHLNCTLPDGDWMQLVVTSFLQDWMKGSMLPSVHMCLAVKDQAALRDTSLLSIADHHIPRLTIIYEENAFSSPTCTSTFPSYFSPNQQLTKQTCCRIPYYINFRETALRDYVLFPSGYDAYACSGWCAKALDTPRKSSILSRNATQDLREWLSEIDRQCRPVSFAPVTVILRDDLSYLQIYSLSDSTVLSCACTR